jgi:hypothetical protein
MIREEWQVRGISSAEDEDKRARCDGAMFVEEVPESNREQDVNGPPRGPDQGIGQKAAVQQRANPKGSQEKDQRTARLNR